MEKRIDIRNLDGNYPHKFCELVVVDGKPMYLETKNNKGKKVSITLEDIYYQINKVNKEYGNYRK